MNDDPQRMLRRAAIAVGVTMIAPETVFLSDDTVLGKRVTIEPFVVFGPGVTVEDGALVAAALDLAERGLDFADALHLTRSGHCEGFVTFDRKLVKSAKAAGYQGVREA